MCKSKGVHPDNNIDINPVNMIIEELDSLDKLRHNCKRKNHRLNKPNELRFRQQI